MGAGRTPCEEDEMDAKTCKIVNKKWRGRSWRKGGRCVRDLRDAAAKAADAHGEK